MHGKRFLALYIDTKLRMTNDLVQSNSVMSPFDNNLQARLTAAISSELIIKIYRKLGINVERFFTGVESVGIYECPLTHYRFYYPPSIMGDAVFYEDLQGLKSDYYPDGKSEFDIAINKLEVGTKVLEVGCGDGKFLERMKAKGFDCVGLEFNDLAIEKCLAKGLDVKRESIEDFAAMNPEKFDAVVLFQVLEHVFEAKPFIQNLLLCLRKGGKLMIAVPDNSPYHKNFRIHANLNLPPHHMGLWNAESFKNLEKVFDVSLVSTEYDDDYSSIPNYVYFAGNYLLTKFNTIYNNDLLRNIAIVLLIPYTLPKVLWMKFKSELRPHSIIVEFRKS